MDPFVFLDRLVSLPDYEHQAVYVQHIPKSPARFGQLDHPLTPVLQRRLELAGVTGLYSHQATATNRVRAGRNVIVATPSASGKSLCYNIPVLEALLSDRFDRAIYLFPTKALAQDQLRQLHELATPDLLTTREYGAFDGDTPANERASIKKYARIVFTNPDMLHVGILPNHQAWSRTFRHLRFVVCDEAHVYRGVFGSHLANIMRRLRRVCQLYGSNPQFILSSATIANPGEHAANLTGLPFEVIDRDGAPHGKKQFVFWNPPLTDAVKATRRSPNSEATAIFSQLVQNGIRTLVFARTRKLTELIFRYTRERLPRDLAKRISPYRAGYLAEDRRRIEQALFNGELRGVVATTALELGVDIGDLDATVLTGYPGSIASTWQQAGRSGRKQGNALTFLVAQNGPLDQYFMRNPDFFFGRNYESALVNPSNLHILQPNLLAAAWETPLGERDRTLFGEAFDRAVSQLERDKKLRERNRRWFPATSVNYPAQDINIRASGENNYALVDASRGYRLLETVSSALAFSQLHTGAIYFHQGDAYLVTRLDLESRSALAEPTNLPYYTVAKEITDVRIVRTIAEKRLAEVAICFGEVEVATAVVGFKKKRQYTEEPIGEEPLDLPTRRFATQAVWFDLPPKAVETIASRGLDFAGGIHALEHAAIGILPLFALCDRNDIGGVSTPMQTETGKPQVFIYDAHPGGIGIAEKGYEIIDRLWLDTMRTIVECPCQEGCPACIQSPKCGNNNEPLDKAAALLLLDHLVLPGHPSRPRAARQTPLR